MRTQKVRKELAQVEQALVDKIKNVGMNKAVELSGLKQPDISAWTNGKRKWTWNKILNVAEKLGL